MADKPSLNFSIVIKNLQSFNIVENIAFLTKSYTWVEGRASCPLSLARFWAELGVRLRAFLRPE